MFIQIHNICISFVIMKLLNNYNISALYQPSAFLLSKDRHQLLKNLHQSTAILDLIDNHCQFKPTTKTTSQSL